MKSPLLTIIIPTYNSGKTLTDCLQSIFIQTFKDFEVLILDGLSSDTTISIVENFQNLPFNLRLISEKDNGIYDAMNTGILKAYGEWLYFLGSDDKLIDEQVLAEVFTNKDNLSVDVLYGNVYSKRFEGIYDGPFTAEKLYEKNICHQAIFFKKSVFAKTGNFDLAYAAHADWDNNYKWFFHHKITNRYIDRVIADYADGGYSSLVGDSGFLQVKDEKFYKLARKSINRELQKSVCLDIVIKKKSQKKYFEFFFYKLNYFWLKYG